VKIVTHSHRHAQAILENVAEYQPIWAGLQTALANISDEKLISHFQENYEGQTKQTKSISKSINKLIEMELGAKRPNDPTLNPENDWIAESQIFGESDYGFNEWRLDFARKVMVQDLDILGDSKAIEAGISIEVAFNNAGSAAWNLVKPVIASELNHVKKNIQTSIGIVIAATEAFKKTGGFDSTVGTYEHYLKMLVPMRDLISVPILVIGLESPESFVIEQTVINGKKYGSVKRLS
jgi:hypothetical protein